MFGLMRPKNCCSSESSCNTSSSFHRMHYCGTCKAIGTEFGQKGRLLLNYDTVFLAELLSHLNKEDLDSWEDALQKINVCWTLPKGQTLPYSLEYAGAVSVLLGELKVDDAIKDSRKWSFRLFGRLFSKTFKEAGARLKSFGVNLDSIYHWIGVQEKRERAQRSFIGLEDCLDFYAEATAKITGQLFKVGGEKAGSSISLYELGYQFGKLMYVLDAFEDYEKDVFKSEFNPLGVYWKKERSLKREQLEAVRSILSTIETRVVSAIELLELPEATKVLYSNRLCSNLALRLYKERVIPRSFKERVVQRWEFAKDFASQVTCQPQSWVRQLNYYMIVLAVFVHPNTSEYLPQDGKMEVFKWTLLLTATLGSLGLLGVIRDRRKSEKKKRKRKGRLKRFFRRMFSKNHKRRGCGECLSCWGGCCDGMSSCDDCEGCDPDGPCFWPLIICLIIAVILAIVISIALLLI